MGLAGFIATAVAYGPARTGYGLFVPDFRGSLGSRPGVTGAIGSGLQGGFLLALVATALLVGRLGPRLLVAAGGVSAIAGMLLVALSPNPVTLAAGVLVAGMSAGFCWSPYNDLAERTVPARIAGTRAVGVSTGTTLGIALSGLVALAAVVGELPWRAAWLAFVAVAVLSAVLNALLLPGMPPGGAAEGRGPRALAGVGWLFRAGSPPLFVVAFSFGVVNAFYWSFNADIVSSAGFPLPNAGPILYAVLGAAGFVGLLTGDLVDRIGLDSTLRITLLCLGAGRAAWDSPPVPWPSWAHAAILYGAGVMFMSALLSLWSSAVFGSGRRRASRRPSSSSGSEASLGPPPWGPGWQRFRARVGLRGRRHPDPPEPAHPRAE